MERREIISRAVSLLVVVAYVAIAAFVRVPTNLTGPIILGVVAGLLMIWFPEQIGSTLLPTLDRLAAADTPPVLVAFMGLGVPRRRSRGHRASLKIRRSLAKFRSGL
jgi:hypothetical protein